LRPGSIGRERSRVEARAAFLAEVKDGSASFGLLRCPLLPYRREGVLHLAFGEPALLAEKDHPSDCGLRPFAGICRLSAWFWHAPVV